MVRLFPLLLICFYTLPGVAAEVLVNKVRLWSSPSHTRLVFETNGPVDHNIFSLKNPDRMVIDLESTRLNTKIPRPETKDPLIGSVRVAPRNKTDLRVVLDLKQGVRPKSFPLGPNRQYGHRLVIDLEAKSASRAIKMPKMPPKPMAKPKPRDIVIAIDAGHGGVDPGAKGPRGTYEKDVVLAIARKLAALVKAEPGMRPAMIRNGDRFLKLRDRVARARRYQADLFISIHADAFRDPRVSGSSVYALSQRGATSEAARWLAERENQADLVGGVSLEDKEDVLASVLLDLSQTATLEASLKASRKVLKNLKKLGKTHKRRVQQAGFVVLKAPDIPSLLVETAYISNPTEERRLNDPVHQAKLASALMRGIRDYFHQYPPPGTLLAQNQPIEHVIMRGDTLSGIAYQYQVSLNLLRSANRLPSDRIRIGQTLRIPGG